jgi:hypothetical protein
MAIPNNFTLVEFQFSLLFTWKTLCKNGSPILALIVLIQYTYPRDKLKNKFESASHDSAFGNCDFKRLHACKYVKLQMLFYFGFEYSGWMQICLFSFQF